MNGSVLSVCNLLGYNKSLIDKIKESDTFYTKKYIVRWYNVNIELKMEEQLLCSGEIYIAASLWGLAI